MAQIKFILTVWPGGRYFEVYLVKDIYSIFLNCFRVCDTEKDEVIHRLPLVIFKVDKKKRPKINVHFD